jgi:two-component system, OmpR family, response regulator RegX3
VSARILLVEDEPAIRDIVAFALRRDGYEVVESDDGEFAAARALREHFDLVLLDVMLPGLSGTEVCRRLRAEGNGNVPIIMLTARGDELDRVLGLELGADDYVTKPFSMPELQARVRALLRRRELDRAGRQVRRIGWLTLDVGMNEAEVEGRKVGLTPSETRLLAVLAEQPDRAVPREELIRALWASDHVGDRRACDAHVVNLRRKLERDPSRPERLITVRGVGYLLRTV